MSVPSQVPARGLHGLATGQQHVVLQKPLLGFMDEGGLHGGGELHVQVVPGINDGHLDLALLNGFLELRALSKTRIFMLMS